MRFGSNVVPIHFMGMLLEGKLWESNFGYRLGFGNGRCDQARYPGGVQDTVDVNVFADGVDLGFAIGTAYHAINLGLERRKTGYGQPMFGRGRGVGPSL